MFLNSFETTTMIWNARVTEDYNAKIPLWRKAMLASLKNNMLFIFIVFFSALTLFVLSVLKFTIFGSILIAYVGIVCTSLFIFLNAEKDKFVSLASDMFSGASDMRRIQVACEKEIHMKAESDVDRTVEIQMANKAKKYFYVYDGISYVSALLFTFLSSRNLSKWERTDLDVIGNIFSKRGNILRAKKFYDQLSNLYLARNQGECYPLYVAGSYALACKWMYLAVARFNNQQAEVYRQNMKLVIVRYPDLPIETKIRLEEILEDDNAYKASQQQLVAKYAM